MKKKVKKVAATAKKQPAKQPRKKDFITLMDYSPKEVHAIIDLADDMKKNPKKYAKSLNGKTLGMIFSKPSTRTRISFDVGIFQLGGQGIFLGANDIQLSRGETIHDTAKVLSRYIDGIMIRTFKYSDVQELAHHASVPVINGLTDLNHPCQVMADMMTIREKFGKKNVNGLKLTYVGDGNNMVHSLMLVCAQFGMDFACASPKGYELPDKEQVMEKAQSLKLRPDSTILFTHDIQEAVKGAHVIYTDTWTSMGQEAERERKLRDFQGFTVDEKVMSWADPKAIFMHCLPAHRHEEVADEVIDGPQSVIFDEAENRLHVQKAIMYSLMK